MGVLARSSAKSAGRVLTPERNCCMGTRELIEVLEVALPLEELHNVCIHGVGEGEVEDTGRVQDPVEKPWAAAVQALVGGGEQPHGLFQVANVLLAIQQRQFLVDTDAGYLFEAFEALLDQELDIFLKKRPNSLKRSMSMATALPVPWTSP